MKKSDFTIVLNVPQKLIQIMVERGIKENEIQPLFTEFVEDLLGINHNAYELQNELCLWLDAYEFLEHKLKK